MAKKEYPKTITINGAEYSVRPMTPKDRDLILNAGQRLSEQELTFMRSDITRPEMVDAWVSDIENNQNLTLLVEENGNLAAFGSLHYNQFFWSRHLAEMRVMVGTAYRNRNLGKAIAKELMHAAQKLKLEKLMIYMAAGDKGAQKMLESLDFRPEALLTDWVKTRDGRTHDLVLMSASLLDAQG